MHVCLFRFLSITPRHYLFIYFSLSFINLYSNFSFVVRFLSERTFFQIFYEFSIKKKKKRNNKSKIKLHFFLFISLCRVHICYPYIYIYIDRFTCMHNFFSDRTNGFWSGKHRIYTRRTPRELCCSFIPKIKKKLQPRFFFRIRTTALRSTDKCHNLQLFSYGMCVQ